MRSIIALTILISTVPVAQARVKTPKSANARADAQSHKAHGKYLSKKIKTKRSKLINHPKA